MAQRGGARPGAGRPPNTLKWAKDLAEGQGIALFACPFLVRALINAGLNGDTTAARYVLDRVFGRLTDATPPWASYAAEIAAELPEDFDPKAILTAPWTGFLETLGDGEFTTAVAAKVGREGLDVLRQRAQRGDPQAAKVLMEYWLGLPQMTLADRAPTMAPEEVRTAMMERWQRYWGWTDEQAAEMFNRAQTSMAEESKDDDDSDEGDR